MKKALIIMLACWFVMTACTKTPEEKATDLVTDAIKQSANDPSSVQDVKLTFLKKKQEVDLHGNKTWHHYVSVEYREKNKYGAIEKKTQYIKMNEECTLVESWDILSDNLPVF